MVTHVVNLVVEFLVYDSITTCHVVVIEYVVGLFLFVIDFGIFLLVGLV